MKTTLAILSLLLPSCTGTIAGLSAPQRDAVYRLAAYATGHAEYVPLIYGARRAVTSAKNPVQATP